MIIEQTINSPLINLNVEKRSILIEGESRPEDVRNFYEPVLLWIDNNLATSVIDEENIEISIDFKLDYFNSASAKYLLEIIEHVNDLKLTNDEIQININWYYDELDVDMHDAGKEFSMLADIPFKYFKIED